MAITEDQRKKARERYHRKKKEVEDIVKENERLKEENVTLSTHNKIISNPLNREIIRLKRELKEIQNKDRELKYTLNEIYDLCDDMGTLLQYVHNIMSNDNMVTGLSGLDLQKNNDKKNKHICPLCMDTIQKKADIYKCPHCGNRFHSHCAYLLILSSKNRVVNCPTCRSKLLNIQHTTEDTRHKIGVIINIIGKMEGLLEERF